MPGIVERGFWRDPNMRAFDDRAKLLALYLLTGPHHNTLGCYYLPHAYVQADLGWQPAQLQRAVEQVEAAGFGLWCRGTDYVLLPKWMQFHPVQNPNQGYARLAQVDEVPVEFALHAQLRAMLERYGGHHLPGGWSDHFDRFETVGKDPVKRFTNGCGTIESDRDRDIERDTLSVPAGTACAWPVVTKLERKSGHLVYPVPFENLWAIYPGRGGAPNSKRAAYRAVRARLQEGVVYDELYQGTVRYRAWCDHVRNTGTRYAKAAATFYGPDEHWTEEYNLDKAGNPIPPTKLENAWAALQAAVQ
jgi:hypothetical protein